MPPVLDPAESKVDGLAFLGLSLARKSEKGHPKSQTHQTAFDLNKVLDRDYEHIFSTNDDGWLVGGGEKGPPDSYKLAAPDSAHVEIMRIGTFNPEWGGISQEVILDAFKNNKILVPEITVVPTAVVANPDHPPELEIRFDMEPAYHKTEEETDKYDLPELPVNWQLRFIHNQLFRHFHFPSRFCPGPFHSTIVRKAEFRSLSHRDLYFDKCRDVVRKWRRAGPKALTPPVTKNIKRIKCPEQTMQSRGKLGNDPKYTSGLYLFTDRNTITHMIEPNFLPPYNTPEKRQLIFQVLTEEWHEKTLTWQPAPPLPKPEIIEPEEENAKKGLDDSGCCGDALCGAQS